MNISEYKPCEGSRSGDDSSNKSCDERVGIPLGKQVGGRNAGSEGASER